MSWLEDQIFAIREAATENIKKLAENFGVDWTVDYIIPKIQELADKQENYLSRLTALFSINKLSTIKYKKIEDSYELSVGMKFQVYFLRKVLFIIFFTKLEHKYHNTHVPFQGPYPTHNPQDTVSHHIE